MTLEFLRIKQREDWIAPFFSVRYFRRAVGRGTKTKRASRSASFSLETSSKKCPASKQTRQLTLLPFSLSFEQILEPLTLVSVSTRTAVSRSSPTTRVTVSLLPMSPLPRMSVSSEMPPRTSTPPTPPTPSSMPSVSSVAVSTTRMSRPISSISPSRSSPSPVPPSSLSRSRARRRPSPLRRSPP